MSDHQRAGRLDERTLEGLLDLEGADAHARLHGLLSAAAGPARPEELAGEDAAVAAFRAAPRPARKSRMAALRRLLTVKALVLVGGSLILTGGAAAAITGNIPGREASPSPSTTPSDRTGTRQNETPATQFAPGMPTGPRSSTPPGASPTPGASKKGNSASTPPGQQKAKPTPPQNTRTPPRGPGPGNGSPPPDIGRPPDTGTTPRTGTGDSRPPTDIKSGNGENGAPAGAPTD
ncbi:hypothetical protein [Spirillospora sp. NPDC048819]|uniref:hypothetical protein n=1 Tax=Spirillospora sp. NPDC048819 TaxID=3155268 RepID=UPI0033FEBAAB